MGLCRRQFIRGVMLTGAATVVASATQGSGLLEYDESQVSHDLVTPGHFDFAFFTDTHIEPELKAADGCAMCFRKMAAAKPEFAIMGGDQVYDAVAVDGTRAKLVFDLYRKTETMLEMPLHQVIGNHDIFGVSR